jgi:hypothetical protein
LLRGLSPSEWGLAEREREREAGRQGERQRVAFGDN